MGDDIYVRGLRIPDHEIVETFHTSGGPGGQHANRSETGVRLRFHVRHSSLPNIAKDQLVSRLGEVIEVTASDERSQARNRELARDRLAELLETGLEKKKKRRKTRRTWSSNERRLKRKRRRAEKKLLRKPPDID